MTQPYFLTDIIKGSLGQLLFLAFKTFNETVTGLTVIISLYFNGTKKNYFVYIALPKHCWAIKLGEFKSDPKYFTR